MCCLAALSCAPASLMLIEPDDGKRRSRGIGTGDGEPTEELEASLLPANAAIPVPVAAAQALPSYYSTPGAYAVPSYTPLPYPSMAVAKFS